MFKISIEHEYTPDQIEQPVIQNYNSYIPPETIRFNENNLIPLTSTEKYFLKSLANKPINNLNLPVYWTYEYNIDYDNLITKLIENKYLTIKTEIDDLSLLTVVQLKSILKLRALPTSGKKQELISRILNSGLPTEEELKSSNLYQQRFQLTPLGKNETINLPQSMTKNLEFEDECISLILKQNFNEAYKIIACWEMKKICPRGLGIYWRQEYEQGLDNDKIKLYSLFWNNDISHLLIKECLDYTELVKASVIFGIMMGVAVDKIIPLLIRLAPNIKKDAELVECIQNLEFLLMDTAQAKILIDLSGNGINIDFINIFKNNRICLYYDENFIETLKVAKSRGQNIDIYLNDQIRIINDSYDLCRNTNSISTFESRLELGLQHTYTLQKAEQFGIYNKEPHSGYLFNLFCSEKLRNDFLIRSYQATLEKAKQELKTNAGIKRRINTFFLEIEDSAIYFDRNIIQQLKDTYVNNDEH